jgi:hypothetical protein
LEEIKMENNNLISFQEKKLEKLYKEFYNAKSAPAFSFFKSDVVYLRKAKPFRLYKKSMCC